MGFNSGFKGLTTLAKRNRPSMFMLEWTGGSVYSRDLIGIVQLAHDVENTWWKGNGIKIRTSAVFCCCMKV